MNTETRCRPWCRQLLAAAVALSLSPTLAFAGDFSASVDARYRYEHVDDDAFANSADAHTLRLRVGGIWQWSPQWSLHGTLEQTSNLNDGFNSTRNGETSYPVVADPRSTERDELFVAYGSERLQARLGRQVINLDNQRYIGAVGWRQNRQSFDGIALDYDVGEQRQLSYRYLSRVIRVFGEHHPNDVLAHRDLDGHLFHFSHPAFDGRLVEYVYRVEDHDVATDSNTTVGLRYTRDAKAVGNWSLGLDLARQRLAFQDLRKRAAMIAATAGTSAAGVTMRESGKAVRARISGMSSPPCSPSPANRLTMAASGASALTAPAANGSSSR